MEMMSDSFSQLKISLCNPQEPESVNSYAIALVIIVAAVLLVLGLGIAVAMFLRRSKKGPGASDASTFDTAADEQAKTTDGSTVDSTAALEDGTESAFKDLEQSMKTEEGSAAADSADENPAESKTTGDAAAQSGGGNYDILH